MADLKKKMEAAKERIAKMKTLANSHKALADKKEAQALHGTFWFQLHELR